MHIDNDIDQRMRKLTTGVDARRGERKRERETGGVKSVVRAFFVTLLSFGPSNNQIQVQSYT